MKQYLTYYHSAAQTIVAIIKAKDVEEAKNIFSLQFPTLPKKEIRSCVFSSKFKAKYFHLGV